MNLFIEQHRSILSSLRRETLTVRQFCEYFDDLIHFLNRTISNRVECYRLLTTISFDFSGRQQLGLFNHSKIIEHPFFLLLSRTFEMLLTKLIHCWLSTIERECLDAISLFITNLCLHKNEVNTNFYIGNNEFLNPETMKRSTWISFEKIFFTETFRSKFVSMFNKNLSTNRIDANDDLKYQLANRFLRLWIKSNRFDHQFIFDGIIRCLKSDIYIELSRSIDLHQPFLNPKEQFFLYQLPKFLQTIFREKRTHLTDLLCEHLVHRSMEIFNHQLPIAFGDQFSSDQRSTKEIENFLEMKIPSITWHIELLNYFALDESSRGHFIVPIFENLHVLHQNTTIVDQMIRIIQAEKLIKRVMKNPSFYHPDVSLVAYALILLYNLIFENKIFRHLKEKSLGILDRLAQAEDKTIQFTATTLTAILQKEKIDKVDHPTTVARSYLYMIENTIDETFHTFHGIKLEGVLTNLENFVQNDEVKEEIVNDDGLILLGECAYRSDLDDEKIRYPALRIIDTISFAESAPEKLKSNERLMDHLDQLSKSNDFDRSIISRRTLWIAQHELKPIVEEDRREVERKQIETIDKSQPEKKWIEKKAIYQYVPGDYRFQLDNKKAEVKKSDIVISYHQSDQTIVEKICEHLTSLRHDDILILEASQGDPEDMASIIGKAHLVLICYSNEYRHSNGCRLHGTFVRTRNKDRIGLRVDRSYHLNGWLEDVFLENRKIDFTMSDFHLNMNELNRLITEFKL